MLDEVAQGPGVAVEVPRGETLVGAVEEGEMGALAHDGRDGLPLLLGEVHAGGIVGAGVEEDDGARRGGAEGAEHAIVVEAFGLRGEVRVVCEVEADVCEDLVVVCPGWAGEVEGWFGGCGVEAGEEESAEVDGAGAGDGLECGDAVVLDGGGVVADEELLGGAGVVCEAFDGEVFVVEAGVVADEVIGLL